MKKSLKNTKKITTDDLAVMVARGFSGVDKRFDVVEKDISELKKDIVEVKKDMSEVKENVKNTRKDVLNLGDRFPSQFAFDQLSSRVYSLEKKVTSKK